MPEEENIEKQIISEIDKIYVNQPGFIFCEISEGKEPSNEEMDKIKEYLNKETEDSYLEGSLANESLPFLYCNGKFLLGKSSCSRGLAPHGLLLNKFIKYTFGKTRRTQELEDWYEDASREGVLGYITKIGGLRVSIFIGEKEWLDSNRRDIPLRQFSAFVILGEKDIEVRTKQKSETFGRRGRFYW